MIVGYGGGAGQQWYRIGGDLDGGVTISMSGNDLRNRIVEVNANGTGSVSFDLDCNNSTLDVCPDDLIVEDDLNDVDVSETGTWRLDYGTCFSDGSLGSITNQNAEFCEGFAYVEFSVGHTAGMEPAMDVWVRWADDDCSTGAVDVPAWYNSSTGKWNTTFDVSAITDYAFKWKGMATYCSNSASGTCQQKGMTRPCDSETGEPPVWFTEQ